MWHHFVHKRVLRFQGDPCPPALLSPARPPLPHYADEFNFFGRFGQKTTWTQPSQKYSPLTLVSLLLLYLQLYCLLLVWRCLISLRAGTVAATRTLRIVSCKVGARLTGSTSTCVGGGCRDSGSVGTELFAAVSKIAPIAERTLSIVLPLHA